MASVKQLCKLELIKYNSVIKHGTLAIGLLATAIITATGLYLIGATSIAQRWTKPLDDSLDEPQEINNTVEDYLKLFPNFVSEKKRIKEELQQISLKSELYKIMATDYYKWLFVALPLTSGAAIISGISLFYISKEGWEKANNYVINIFIVSSAVALFVGSLPVIFKIEDNAKTNAGFFVLYDNLKNQVLTRLATLQPDSNQQKARERLQAIINDTELKIEELNKISIVFDANSINLPSILPNTTQPKQ